MEAFVQVGVEIDSCASCGGVWLDHNEWGRLTRGRGDQAVRLTVVNCRPTEFPCPRCRTPLEEGNHSESLDFQIDYCPGCGGGFFDRGEMVRLLAR